MSGRDIYSDYIKKARYVKPDSPKECSIAVSDTVSGGYGQQMELLQQISKKLDSFGYHGDKPLKTVDLAIHGGDVVIPGHGILKTNVYISNGKVVALSSDVLAEAGEVIDATGKYVLPGIIDPHVHLGLFAPLETELDTETGSALIGGVTTIGCYFGGDKSHFKSFPGIEEKINLLSHTDVLPHLVISTEMQVKEIADYINYLGITSFKLYMNGIPGLIPSVGDDFILDVFNQTKKVPNDCMICVHAENSLLVRRAERLEKERLGEDATIRDWSNTHPAMAEEEAVIRLSYLAEKTNTPVYFVHLSTAGAVERLRKLKPFNKYIHVETTSPYLSLARDNLTGFLGKMEPPFRDFTDIEELWKGLEDGIVDTIGTDNVTITVEEKSINDGIWNAMPGYPAMATHLPVLMSEGVVKRGMDIEKLVTAITKNPASIFGVYPRKGTILPGSDADIVIIDLQLSKEVKAEDLQSRSDFSLYDGKRLQGWPVLTIKGGKVAARDGRIVGHGGKGTLIKR